MTNRIDSLLEQRGKLWGDATDTHIRIAQVWGGIKGVEFTPTEVALMMAGLKLVRASISPNEPDSYDDAHGYVTIAENIQGVNQPQLPLADVPWDHAAARLQLSGNSLTSGGVFKGVPEKEPEGIFGGHRCCGCVDGR